MQDSNLLAEESNGEEESQETADESEEDRSQQPHEPAPSLGQPKVLFGTHLHRGAQTAHACRLLRDELFFGIPSHGVALLIAWLIYLLVALAKNPGRAWPLAALTAAVLAGQCVARAGLHKRIGAALPALPGVALLAVLGLLALGMLAVVAVQVVPPGPEQKPRLQALLGTATFVGLSAATSHRIRNIQWQLVLSAMLVQFYLGIFVMRTETGMSLFKSLGDAVSDFLDYSDKGAEFVFGDDYRQTFFAFKVLPTVVFFSAFISTMYYLGVLQVVVRVLAVILKYTIGTNLVQSVNAAGNLFLGQTEAPLLIKPFLATASPCDIHCIMVGGFASIAGGVLAAYIGMGVKADQLIGASVMSVPGTLLISNLVCPPGSADELKVERDTGEAEDFYFPPASENNIIEAAGNGAHIAIDLVLNIGAMLIAFLSLIAVLDAALGYLGGLVDLPGLSFAYICGYTFWPVAWLLGAPAEDCFQVARLIGTKIFLNEFVAYSNLAEMLKDPDGPQLSSRAELAATYALCGFSNVGAIGVQLGGLSALCPARSRAFAKLVVSAMIAGNTVCLITATMAGVLN